jgi:hypothetical protein
MVEVVLRKKAGLLRCWRYVVRRVGDKRFALWMRSKQLREAIRSAAQ